MERKLRKKIMKLHLLGIGIWFLAFGASFLVMLLLAVLGVYLVGAFSAAMAVGFAVDAVFLWRGRSKLILSEPDWNRDGDALMFDFWINLALAAVMLCLTFAELC